MHTHLDDTTLTTFMPRSGHALNVMQKGGFEKNQKDIICLLT